MGVHLRNKLLDIVPVGTRSELVHVAGAELDWTVAPRFEVGYRTPQGFAEFLVAYRLIATEGQTDILNPPGIAHEKSRLNLNVIDLAYANREFPPGPCWEMRWKVGVRLAGVFFDADSSQAMSPANPGGGVAEHTSSFYLGAGPVVGLELGRQLGWSGLALYSHVEGAYLWGHLHQEFGETLTFPGGAAVVGQADGSTSQGVAVVLAELGLCWTPPAYNFSRFFLGYQFEFWSQIGRDDNTGSRGDLYEHGIFFRAEINF
jgi:hypothetical protein